MKSPSMIKPEAKDEISALKKRIRELEQSEPDLKRAEERLRESEARFRNEQKFSQLLLDTAPAFIVTIDLNGKTLMMNQALLDALEYTREEIMGADYLATFVPEEDRQGLTRVFQQIINEGKATVNENRIRNKSGQTYLIEWHSGTVHKEGDVGFFVGVGIDITKRKQAELELKVIDRALASSEEKYRDLVENANSIILRMDTTGRITFFNAYASRFLGFSRDAIIGHNVVGTIVPPTDSAGKDLAQMILDIGTHPELYKNNENENMRKDGTRVWVAWTNKPILDDQGRCIEILCIGNDTTERKQAEEALKESEGIFSHFMEHSPIYVFFKDENVRTIKLSKNYEALLGRPLRECIGKTMYDLFPSDLSKNMIEDDLKVLREGKPIEINEELGGRFYSTTKFPVLRDGKPPFLAGFTIDITSHKQAEEEIVREKNKLKTLSDNAPFGMVLIDKEGYFTYINSKFIELFGYELSDVPDGRTWCRKAYPDAEYRYSIISAWVEDFSDARPGERKPRVFTVTCKDGMQKIVQLITSVLVSGDYLMTCEDITEMRRLESQLRQAQKMEAIGTLAGGIAHDFNNILTALMGYASLVQMKMATSNPLRAYVDEVLIASKKAVDLTQSLLAFSRQQSVTLVPLNMNSIIKEAKKLLRRLLTEDIAFHTSLTEADMIVMADKSQMDQILFNLVTNARDAMPKGGILTIETAIAAIDSTFIKVHGFGEQGQYVRISITDTGTGMDEITQSKIFDPFFTTKEVGRGTGLGLATVYGIVKTHSGYITIESTLNQGTTFHVYLPKVMMTVDEAEDTIIAITGGKETILIAEDNEGVRRFMREALQKYGYTIREAVDGENAIEKFKEHRDIELIIIDSVMPKKNGRETYEEIHRIDPHIKVLFTSGYTKDIVLDKGIKEKEFDSIGKPLSLNKLLHKVREVLDREQTSEIN